MTLKTAILMLSILLLTSVGCAADIQSWTVATVRNDHADMTYSILDITFTFADGTLSLNKYRISGAVYPGIPGQWYSIGANSYLLSFYGCWAAAGQYSADGVLSADPYASFMIDRNGAGHVVWGPNTPLGYQAPVVLGRPGQGYTQDYLELIYSHWLYNDGGDEISQITHTFYATYIPEPSSLLALLAGLGGILSLSKGGAMLKRRRCDPSPAIAYNVDASHNRWVFITTRADGGRLEAFKTVR